MCWKKNLEKADSNALEKISMARSSPDTRSPSRTTGNEHDGGDMTSGASGKAYVKRRLKPKNP